MFVYFTFELCHLFIFINLVGCRPIFRRSEPLEWKFRFFKRILSKTPMYMFMYLLRKCYFKWPPLASSIVRLSSGAGQMSMPMHKPFGVKQSLWYCVQWRLRFEFAYLVRAGCSCVRRNADGFLYVCYVSAHYGISMTSLATQTKYFYRIFPEYLDSWLFGYRRVCLHYHHRFCYCCFGFPRTVNRLQSLHSANSLITLSKAVRKNPTMYKNGPYLITQNRYGLLPMSTRLARIRIFLRQAACYLCVDFADFLRINSQPVV